MAEAKWYVAHTYSGYENKVAKSLEAIVETRRLHDMIQDIKVPTVNPMELYRAHQGRKEAEKEAEKLDALMHNIEVYDGTSAGQKDIPQ